MTLADFEGSITMDKNLASQQNLNKFSVAIFVLRGINNKLETLQQLVPQVLSEIEKGINIGVFEIRK